MVTEKDTSGLIRQCVLPVLIQLSLEARIEVDRYAVKADLDFVVWLKCLGSHSGCCWITLPDPNGRTIVLGQCHELLRQGGRMRDYFRKAQCDRYVSAAGTCPVPLKVSHQMGAAPWSLDDLPVVLSFQRA